MFDVVVKQLMQQKVNPRVTREEIARKAYTTFLRLAPKQKELDLRQFYDMAIKALMDECGITEASAKSHYTIAWQKARKQHPTLVEGLRHVGTFRPKARSSHIDALLGGGKIGM